jgi:hypothetical protein
MDKIGRICFIAGVVVSIIAGFFHWYYIFPILTVLGLIVGFLNVQAKEVQSFLLAGIALVIISGFGAYQISTLPVVGHVMGRIYMALLSFVGPATLIVALKSLFGLAKT